MFQVITLSWYQREDLHLEEKPYQTIQLYLEEKPY